MVQHSPTAPTLVHVVGARGVAVVVAVTRVGGARRGRRVDLVDVPVQLCNCLDRIKMMYNNYSD